ncbi:energy transducer TonB [Aquincola tertiaricarbonis]|uniref:energy transducer TonB n=1 Tax=Aquincola tertiaricarbonis TaxID=391953 RepID=UPI0009F8811C|nr:TonB family protein [Aquincola tertiaricarbonis]
MAAAQRLARGGGGRPAGRPALLRRLRGWGTLQWALLASVGVHAGLLTMQVASPAGLLQRMGESPLEVILVNARGAEPPPQAQALAQAALAGGGEATQGRATSPLPPTLEVRSGEDADSRQRRIEQMQTQQQQLLAQVRRELALLPPPDPRRDTGAADGDAQEEKRRQMLRLLAEIETRINQQNAEPRRRYISPATREVTYATYYDRLRRRIEERGTRDFPRFQGRKLYGELTMNVTVDALGQVVEAEVLRSSGNRHLDQRAVAIVHAASPFGRFNAAMQQEADQIVVTSRFRFTRDDGLETSLSATSRR